MNKLFATFGVATVMVLGGCTTATPAATVTVTAMQIPVDIVAVEAITEALIYAIKGEQK